MPDILVSENFDNATLQQLLDARAKLDAEIRTRKSAERTKGLAEIRQIMATHGLTMKDLGASARRGYTQAAVADGADPAPASRAASTSKVRPKYKDPTTGDSWTGRGMTPKWLRDHEEAGRPRANYLITS